jgi:hypothetical protein
MRLLMLESSDGPISFAAAHPQKSLDQQSSRSQRIPVDRHVAPMKARLTGK